ncbi:autotransporter outer membrane beta-barrel domain-containing protein [Salmonella bongori]|uniref:autotransporter outer membrane beta-barrel domain-containing protein n=1 Tax=Salmonella bongori TaxID=54736 RepID=UPI0009AA375B|nr:autotransporter outer membrane beta-barrel domain-containing protein [Salmonella bongori]EHM2230633.1 autotransporter outer membrane beta-barrel domain-containing protein [Salmonella bongori]EHM2232189.1 autotransporter outer membrane beta-barrel domain-containing protein [Salmonella bongori]EIT4621843.1 autotransporter outer membrane beta-barrel domain-containing protein [Salmonella bongori]
MIVKKRRGRRALRCLACLMACSFFINAAYAWQQEYIAEAAPGHTMERYTWDSDHQPNYNDILAERIQSTQNAAGPVLNLAVETPLDATSGISMGWNFPVSSYVTTGPVAALHYDGSTSSMYNEYGDSATVLAFTDPLWHASVSTLGWRVNSQFGDVRPWAQISYNQQFGENIWKAQSGLSRMTAASQEGNWLDVTVGADMLLNPHLAAYAAFSQAENSATDSDYLYTMGVSAKF